MKLDKSMKCFESVGGNHKKELLLVESQGLSLTGDHGTVTEHVTYNRPPRAFE